MPRTCLCILLFLTLAPSQGAIRAAEPIDYVREIKPLLTARCVACHGSLQQKGALRIDTVKSIRTGGDSGPALVPGKPDESLILAHITATGGKRRMPPPSEGERLTEAEVARLRTWIAQGANSPPDEKPEADPRDHWAFRPPVRPAVPMLPDAGRIRNPVDAFLAAARAKAGVKLQPPADRRVLLRRLHLDLVGLPPSRAELDAFANSPNPDADYAKIVDRLLASPQYGERWGRHWMDIWRYSDWWGLGAEVRNSQKHMWHWRDWIIESLNADKGYDQMVREMFAADELYPTDLGRLRATGFLARQYFKFNRNTWLEETVEHTSKAFLGLTMNCAKCHDHKFDPITQTDYYRFRAFFEPYQVRQEMVPGQPDFEKDGLPRAFDCNLDAPTYLFRRGNEKDPITKRPLAPGLPSLLSLGDLVIRPVTLPAEAHSPGLRPHVLDEQLRQAESQIETARQALSDARKALAVAEKRPVDVTAPSPMAGGKGKVLFHDDFAKPNPDLWQIGPGQWKHEGGQLIQTQAGMVRSSLRAKQRPPADFQATFRFAITGGEPFRSVGLTFDVARDNEVLVYVSAQTAGSKVQIAYKNGATHTYPAGAMQARPIPLNQPIELTVRVRGSLVNVAVDGKHVVAYRLPNARQAGDLELITFTAQASFRSFELADLPADVALIEGKAGPAPKKPLTVAECRAAVVVAEKVLAVAEAQPASLRVRAAAQRDPKAKDLARQAALAERQAGVAKAEEALARAELELLQTTGAKKPTAEKKRDVARSAVATARKALDAPGENFTPLRGALKTVESSTETEAQRNRPFPTTSTGRRTALAQWLTDRRHPLTARVAVNHVWARHFGTPLVATVFDFGRKGAAPTHPELLDWLAVEFMENGWSMRHLHRLLVLSETYRTTSSSAGTAVSADPENRLLWRMNPVRMDAPTLRDSLLSLAGELDPAMGGPSIPARDEASHRRSLYFFHSHNEHQKFLSMFDDASVLECYRRAESILPQQALALSNSKFVLTMAGKINDRLAGVADSDFVRAAFETVLAATPTAAELTTCTAALAEWETLFKGQPDAKKRARGDLINALLNHNDFITIR